MAEPHKTIDHSLLEDVQAFLLGTALCALGVQFLGFNSLVTGQTAGLGVVFSYLTDAPFSLWFFGINLPFYVLAWLRMGPRFTVKSFIAVALVSGLAEVFSKVIAFETLPPALGGPLAGALIGLGLVVIFRHGASLGGIGVLALYLQDRTGFQAGWTQLLFDAVLFGAAFFLFDPMIVVWSLLGAVVTNLIIATNHRKDRYIAR
jgi:uncharacterized membrane-anchored protein YitT (DUF2179 family)